MRSASNLVHVFGRASAGVPLTECQSGLLSTCPLRRLDSHTQYDMCIYIYVRVCFQACVETRVRKHMCSPVNFKGHVRWWCTLRRMRRRLQPSHAEGNVAGLNLCLQSMGLNVAASDSCLISPDANKFRWRALCHVLDLGSFHWADSTSFLPVLVLYHVPIQNHLKLF